MLYELIGQLPTRWIENFVDAFEEGRVQKHPQARFVNRRGECCLVGALAGARSAAEVVMSEVWPVFLNSPLEELSRRFETRSVTAQTFYEEALLALTARRCAAPHAAGLAHTELAHSA